jgi:hypothetical protein
VDLKLNIVPEVIDARAVREASTIANEPSTLTIPGKKNL